MLSGLEKKYYDVPSYYDLPLGDQQTLQPIKCVCGVDITMGSEAQPMFHSDYCPKSKHYQPTAQEDKNEKR